ncbi:UDP-glucuronosyltransferase 2B16-like isoform X2 [Lytechinus variegatus]|uniref:UDP-glucuronosyltransferase 2B16-like isoform X2 n=1 Tax=Lytechinus variegatus TaxID=7654 RepID=UPI001BB19E39|nr:UDP-glucuronosyltransferase 2B16-like isoform X2 [Lytechinus variegatus]
MRIYRYLRMYRLSLCCYYTVVFFSIVWQTVSSFNILVSPVYGEGSHFFAGAAVAQGLVDKGHNVTVLISRAYEHRTQDPRYSKLHFLIFDHRNRSTEDVRQMFFQVNTFVFKSKETQLIELFSLVSESMAEDCECVLRDVTIMKQLEGIDAIIVDPTWICGMVMRHVLERTLNYSKHIKMISMTPNIPDGTLLLYSGSYLNLAFQPEISSGYTNRMTFLQRVNNVFFFSSVLFLASKIAIPPYEKVARNMGFDQNEFDLSLWTWHKYFDLHLINIHTSSEFPFPLAPNIILIGGGLTVTPPAKLDKNLEEFVNSSGDEGIIVFTLGTYFSSVTKFEPEFVDLFAEAFQRLPQKVIWQLKELPKKELPSNVKALPWVPQNDLLGHPKLRVIITHGGNNGFQEACSHGVPMVIIPFIADQYDVGARVEARGMGRSLDKHSLSADVIYETLHEVINNPSYAQVAKEVSSIIKNDFMSGKERAAFWVDHVIRYGGEYLRSPAAELSFIQFYMLDVLAFLSALLCIILLLVFFCLRFCFRLCFRLVFGRTKSKTD